MTFKYRYFQNSKQLCQAIHDVYFLTKSCMLKKFCHADCHAENKLQVTTDDYSCSCSVKQNYLEIEMFTLQHEQDIPFCSLTGGPHSFFQTSDQKIAPCLFVYSHSDLYLHCPPNPCKQIISLTLHQKDINTKFDTLGSQIQRASNKVN